jgi:hypothetical protein
MSKKYVPSFLKDSPLTTISDLSSLPVRERTNDFPDAFQMKKTKKETTDLFPMSRKKVTDFDAFTKVQPMPEMDAFSMNRKRPESTSDFDAFSRNPKRDDFPMSKESNRSNDTDEYDPFRSKKQKENRRSHDLPQVIPTASFAPGTLASLTARKASDEAAPATDDAGNSFAAKFAQRMKIMEDPDFVPPPSIVNVSSEEDFPTLGFATVKSKQSTSTWGLPSSTLLVVEDPVCADMIEETVAVEGNTVSKPKNKKKIPILRRKLTTTLPTEEDGVFKPIEYDEDAFEEDELNQSDIDEEEFFHDSGEEDEEEDELNPNVYDDRRYRYEIC